MNFFNRILIVFATFAIMAFSLLLFLHTFQISIFEGIDISLSQIVWIIFNSEGDFRTRLVIRGICLLVFFMGAVLIYLELLPLFLREKRFLVNKDEFGKVEIVESSINKFINYEAKLFEGVLEASSQIKEQKDGLYVTSEITFEPKTKIVEVTGDIQETLKNRMQEKLGLYVTEISIKTKFKETKSSISKLN